MKLVGADEKGISVKLHPRHKNRIFTDRTDDGKDIVLVEGRVIRVDERGGTLAMALHRPEDPGDGGPAVPRLVETDEEPTPVVEPTLETADQRLKRLQVEAAQMGFALSPQVEIREGDSMDFKGRLRSEVGVTDSSGDTTAEGAGASNSDSLPQLQSDKGSAKSGTLPKAESTTSKSK